VLLQSVVYPRKKVRQMSRRLHNQVTPTRTFCFDEGKKKPSPPTRDQARWQRGIQESYFESTILILFVYVIPDSSPVAFMIAMKVPLVFADAVNNAL